MRWRYTRGDVSRFLDDPRIEPTNDRARRAQRPDVIARKVSKRSRNQPGADAHVAFASVLGTTVQQSGSGTKQLVHLGRFPPAADR